MSCAFSKLLQGCLSCLLGLTVNDFLLAQRTLVWRYCLHSAELPCLRLARGDLCHDAQTVATSCRQSVESRCALAGLHFAYLDVDKFSLPFKSRPGHIWKVYFFLGNLCFTTRMPWVWHSMAKGPNFQWRLWGMMRITRHPWMISYILLCATEILLPRFQLTSDDVAMLGLHVAKSAFISAKVCVSAGGFGFPGSLLSFFPRRQAFLRHDWTLWNHPKHDVMAKLRLCFLQLGLFTWIYDCTLRNPSSLRWPLMANTGGIVHCRRYD